MPLKCRLCWCRCKIDGRLREERGMSLSFLIDRSLGFAPHPAPRSARSFSSHPALLRSTYRDQILPRHCRLPKPPPLPGCLELLPRQYQSVHGIFSSNTTRPNRPCIHLLCGFFPPIIWSSSVYKAIISYCYKVFTYYAVPTYCNTHVGLKTPLPQVTAVLK